MRNYQAVKKLISRVQFLHVLYNMYGPQSEKTCIRDRVCEQKMSRPLRPACTSMQSEYAFVNRLLESIIESYLDWLIVKF